LGRRVDGVWAALSLLGQRRVEEAAQYLSRGASIETLGSRALQRF